MTGNHTRKTDPFINIIFSTRQERTAMNEETQNPHQEQIAYSEAKGLISHSEELEKVCHKIGKCMTDNQNEWENRKMKQVKGKNEIAQARQFEQLRLERDITDIENDNYVWTNIHTFIGHIVTKEDIDEVIAQCEYEQQNNVPDGFFEKRYPSDVSSKQKAQKEADVRFDVEGAEKDYYEANKEWSDLTFEEEEPTREDVIIQLEAEAEEKISAFFPWKQARLRNEYVINNFDERFLELHDRWQSRKEEYESVKSELFSRVQEKNWIASDLKQSKTNYIVNRTKELYDAEIEEWELERDEFYTIFQKNLQNVVTGNKDYVTTVINSIFPCDGIPMEYLVDFVYEVEKGRVMVDLNLPKIGDLPDRKIILTPTGKKSIRLKGQTDLRVDYAHCVMGLALYVAYMIFNVSLKIQTIEVSGYTQRRESNSAFETDQYIYVIRFTRELFSKIDFNRFSSLQIVDFFQHYYDMTRSYDMKHIFLGSAYVSMDSYITASYIDHSMTNTSISSWEHERENKEDDEETSVSFLETFNKSYNLIKEINFFLEGLSKIMAGFSKDYQNILLDNTENQKESLIGYQNSCYELLSLCTAVDMFCFLEKMHINPNNITPASYPLFLLLNRSTRQIKFNYISKNVYVQLYKSQLEALRSIAYRLPPRKCFYLIEEVFSNNKDIWYHTYIEYMSKYTEIIRDTFPSSTLRKWQADRIYKEQQCILSTLQQYSYKTDNNSDIIDLNQLDPLFSECAKLVVATGQGSPSMIQRKFQIGYNRAGRIMDQLEASGIVGPYSGSKARMVLVSSDSELQSILEDLQA